MFEAGQVDAWDILESAPLPQSSNQQTLPQPEARFGFVALLLVGFRLHPIFLADEQATRRIREDWSRIRGNNWLRQHFFHHCAAWLDALTPNGLVVYGATWLQVKTNATILG